MFLLIALAASMAFVTTIGVVLLISIDRAASLVDSPSIDLSMPRE